jgi:hypothetical protein
MPRRTIAATILLTLTLALCGAGPDSKPEPLPPEPEGMEQLFNGRDLTGWDGDPRLWSVKDGAIHGETTKENPAKGNTFLVCKASPAGDFDLRLTFRCTASNNSGVQYRSKHITEGRLNNAWVVRGYQGEIRNETELPNVSGFIYDEGGKRGRLVLVGERAVWENGKKTVTARTCTAEEFKRAFRLDGWNEYVIIARANRIRQYVNGVLTVDFTDNEKDQALKSGIVALQLHAGNPMWAEFKDVRIKRYDAAK